MIETKALRRSERRQDGAPALGLARPALAADRDHDRRRRPGLARPSPTRRGASSSSVIATETARLSRLVDNLLDLSRLQAGEAEPRARLVLGRRAHRARPSSPVPSPPGGFDVRSTRPAAARGRRRPARARARERARERGPLRGRRAGRVRGRAADRLVLIRVTDHGPGIAEDELERIFEPFHALGERRRRLGPRAGDRARLRRGERRPAPRGVAARAGHHAS